MAFRKNEAEDWRWYTAEELNSDIIRTLEAGSELKYFVTSPAEEEKLRSRIQELGLTATKPVRRDVFPPEPEVKTHVKCIFDLNMARCETKIAFNYFAYVLQENTRLLLRQEFDAIRSSSGMVAIQKNIPLCISRISQHWTSRSARAHSRLATCWALTGMPMGALFAD